MKTKLLVSALLLTTAVVVVCVITLGVTELLG